MILSDRSIREELAAGRIAIDPLDEEAIQPSSVDLRLDRFFRVFLNHTMPVIDVRQDLSELTEEVEIEEGGAFILHPGEFVLGSTLERVAVPDDIVARIDGKSSLGRLGLLIHSSLPASEELLVRQEGQLTRTTIGEIVKQQSAGQVVSFDPDTFEVGYHDITGWFEGPPDRIYEVRLASGRSVRVTAGHNLFTLDPAGDIRKARTAELATGTFVAVPRRIPESARAAPRLRLLDAVPESERPQLVLSGPTVDDAFVHRAHELASLLLSAGLSVSYYRARRRLPWSVAAQIPGLIAALGRDDRCGRRGERHSLPVEVELDEDLAWLLGMYVAEGHRRRRQVTISNTEQHRLDRLQATFGRLGLPVSRSAGAVTCCSSLLSDLFGWLGMGGKAPTKRVPPAAFGWPDALLRSLLTGLVDGDGSTAGGRTSVWTTSEGLLSDVLLIFARLGRRAGSYRKDRSPRPIWQAYAPDNEHKLLTTIPLTDELLIAARREANLSQVEASAGAGYRHATDLNNIERGAGRDALRRSTLGRLRDLYARSGARPESVAKLHRLVDGDLAWDRVTEVVDTGDVETIYDLEVRPAGRKIENFLAGSGGVFVSNTAGFIDPGFDGHITLELSNVANLPITLYPGMRVGQISFLRMTTPADVPYGASTLGSKYQGQRGPTPSRYFENFRDLPADLDADGG